MDHDVIIVGARCAGSVLATLLAKAGVRVLLLDRDAMPSDMPMSTHFVQPPGMDVLDAIGVGDQVRACTPPSKVGRFRVETHDVYANFPAGRPGYCVRRGTLDPMLQQAAVDAGAELRDRHSVVELLRDGERVTGVVVEGPGGRQQLRAGLVVGADGRKSTVARLAGAETYLRFPMTRGGYWFYFDAPDMWRSDPRYRDWDASIAWEGDGLRYVFQTDGDQLILIGLPPAAEARTWGKDYRARTMDYLRASEVTGPLLDATAPKGKGVGLLKAEFFYRRPVGPGFALVGDAGNFKDFVTGHGMADAFLGAQRLSRAILAGQQSAFERYWRERDVATLPLYFDALRLGEVGFNDGFHRALFEKLAGNTAMGDRLTRISDRTLDPMHAFSIGEMLSALAPALLRGNFGALGDFLRTGKRMQGYAAEIARRQALLDALPPAPPSPVESATMRAAAE